MQHIWVILSNYYFLVFQSGNNTTKKAGCLIRQPAFSIPINFLDSAQIKNLLPHRLKYVPASQIEIAVKINLRISR